MPREKSRSNKSHEGCDEQKYVAGDGFCGLRCGGADSDIGCTTKTCLAKPDIVFGPSKVAVFVDGDYWHGNQWRLRKKKSLIDQLKNVNNKAYWIKKIEGKTSPVTRENNLELKKAGWTVIRLWESDILKRPEWCADQVEEEVMEK